MITRKAPASVAHPHHLHETPGCATLALLAACPWLPNRIWEPAAGRGAIVTVLRERGFRVYATDLVDYGSPYVNLTGQDFFTSDIGMEKIGAEAIVTNPPYKFAAAFAARAIELAPTVALLLPLSFWEAGDPKTAAGRARNLVLDTQPPAECLVFANRLPMLHRDGYEGKKLKSSTHAFAWFIWRRGHASGTVTRRIRWEGVAAPTGG